MPTILFWYWYATVNLCLGRDVSATFTQIADLDIVRVECIHKIFVKTYNQKILCPARALRSIPCCYMCYQHLKLERTFICVVNTQIFHLPVFYSTTTASTNGSTAVQNKVRFRLTGSSQARSHFAFVNNLTAPHPYQAQSHQVWLYFWQKRSFVPRQDRSQPRHRTS